MALISIILPVYNTEDFIEDTLKSLMRQTHKDIEILCVNDGSTDSSGEIIEKLAAKDKRIKYFKQENAGPAAARNKGLDNATGKYIMFCDSDDLYDPELCREVHHVMENNGDVDVCMYHVVNENPRITDAYLFPLEQGKYPITQHTRAIINIYLWNKIYRKSVIDQYGVRFPDGLKADDNLFVHQFFACAKQLACLDKKLYRHIEREGSIISEFNSNRVKLKDALDKVEILGLFADFLTRNDLWEDNELSFTVIFGKELAFTWMAVGDAWIEPFLSRLGEVAKPFEDRIKDPELKKLVHLIETKQYRAVSGLMDARATLRFKKMRRRHLGQELLKPAFEKNNVPVVLASDNNFVPYLSTVLQSIMAHASDASNYDIIVLTEDISEFNRETLQCQVAGRKNFSLRIFSMSGVVADKEAQDLAIVLPNMKLAAYYRLFIPDILRHYDKVVYLDCDLILRADVADLYNTNLEGKSVGAVIDYFMSLLSDQNEGGSPGIMEYMRSVLNIDSLESYFNSGVLVMDVQKLIARNAMPEFLEVARRNNKYFHDQNVLNSVLQGDVHFLDPGWNYQCSGHFKVQHAMPLENIRLVHYCSRTKPWNAPYIRLSHYFWQHARECPFYENMMLVYVVKVTGAMKSKQDAANESAYEREAPRKEVV